PPARRPVLRGPAPAPAHHAGVKRLVTRRSLSRCFGGSVGDRGEKMAQKRLIAFMSLRADRFSSERQYLLRHVPNQRWGTEERDSGGPGGREAYLIRDAEPAT